jgi:hypothetical protein
MDEVKITGTHDDVVQVMRAWDIEAPDWTPQYNTKPIAPRKITGVWIDGVIDRAAVTGPYRLKSGKTSQDWGGTGDNDHRPGYGNTTSVSVGADGRVPYGSSYEREQFPDWVPQFIADNAPTI